MAGGAPSAHAAPAACARACLHTPAMDGRHAVARKRLQAQTGKVPSSPALRVSITFRSSSAPTPYHLARNTALVPLLTALFVYLPGLHCVRRRHESRLAPSDLAHPSAQSGFSHNHNRRPLIHPSLRSPDDHSILIAHPLRPPPVPRIYPIAYSSPVRIACMIAAGCT